MKPFRFASGVTLLTVFFAATADLQSQVVRSASGPNTTDIQSAVDTFRTDLGTLNPNVAGSFGSGRREINWDGVPATLSAPNQLPANFFNVNSPRGAVFSTPGTGFQVSGATADAGVGQPAAANFGNIDPSYTTTFGQFSPQRLFTPLGSNILDITFFIPGSATPGLVKGFGAVFTDVDLADTTSIQFFDAAHVSLGTFFFVPALVGSATFSFLGVSFADSIVSSVRISLGNTVLGAGSTDQNGNLRDVVVMDDFIYAEPVPEPATVALLTMGAFVFGARLRQRRKN